MKEVNTKTACATWRKIEALREALGALRLRRDSGWSGYEEDIAAAQTRLDEAHKAFREDAGVLRLAAALDEVQGRSKERKIGAEDIVYALCRIEDKLGISKKALEGVRLVADLNAQKFPNAYKWTPMSTWFYAYYKAGSWRVWSVARERTAQRKDGIGVFHTEASKAALLDRFSSFSL